MTVLFVSIGILILVRLPLLLYMKSFGDLSGSDAISHRVFFRIALENPGRLIGVQYDRYLLDSAVSTGLQYPLGYVALLRAVGFTERGFDRFGPFLTVFWDALLLGTVFAAMRYFALAEPWWLLFLPLQQILTIHMGRGFHHSERSFAAFLCNVFALASVGVFLEGFTLLWMILGIASVTLVTVSSKFSWQALSLLSILSALLLQSLIPVFFFSICVATAAVLTGFQNIRVIILSLAYLRFYARYLRGRAKNLRPSFYKEAVSLPLRLRRRHWISAMDLVCNNPLLGLISLLPVNLILLFWFAMHPTMNAFAAWWMAGVLLVVFVAMQRFAMIGHPIRYLECVLVPIFLLLGSIPMSEVPRGLFWIFLAITMSVPVMVTIIHVSSYNAELRRRMRDEEEAIRFLQSVDAPDSLVICTAFYRFLIKIHLHINRFRYVGFLGGVDSAAEKMVLEAIPLDLAFFSDNTEKFIRHYGVDFFIIDCRRPLETPRDSWPGTCIFENDTIHIRRIQKGSIR